jgi:hypothetical protein
VLKERRDPPAEPGRTGSVRLSLVVGAVLALAAAMLLALL